MFYLLQSYVIKPLYIALFVVSRSMKKLFSIDCVNIYYFYSIENYLFSIFFQWIKNCWATPHRLDHDSLTLKHEFAYRNSLTHRCSGKNTALY